MDKGSSEEFRQAVSDAIADANEPPIEEKARFIAEEGDDYPAHWADEVAQAYLDMQGAVQQFEQRLVEVTKERHNRLLLQVATPILAALVRNMTNYEFRDALARKADDIDGALDETGMLINEAVDHARGLLKACEVQS